MGILSSLDSLTPRITALHPAMRFVVGMKSSEVRSGACWLGRRIYAAKKDFTGAVGWV